MRFTDVTIVGSEIFSRRTQNTKRIVPQAITMCREVLRRLDAGETRVGHGLPGLAQFETMRGFSSSKAFALLTPDLSALAAPARCVYSVAEPRAETPFQVNIIVPAGHLAADAAEADRRAIAALLRLSAFGLASATSIARTTEHLWALRPLLATVVLPVRFNLDTVITAADYSTCLAAAVLGHRPR